MVMLHRPVTSISKINTASAAAIATAYAAAAAALPLPLTLFVFLPKNCSLFTYLRCKWSCM